MNINHEQKLDKSFKWSLILGGVVLLTIIIGVTTENNNKETQPNIVQPQISELQNIQNESISIQTEKVEDYLIKIKNLGEECRKGDIYIRNIGQHDGVALTNIAFAQAIYESVLERIQQLKVPIEGQYVQANFFEATQTGLNGIKMMQLGYEKQPIDEDKIWQGLEIYGQSMLSLTRMNEEILNLVKEELGLE